MLDSLCQRKWRCTPRHFNSHLTLRISRRYRKVGLAPNIAVIAHAPLGIIIIALLVFGSAVTALVLVSSPQFPPLTAVQFQGQSGAQPTQF
jgi:hypothetical protein